MQKNDFLKKDIKNHCFFAKLCTLVVKNGEKNQISLARLERL